MDAISWHFRRFAELSVDELYSMMELREAVFVVEQECAYLDADGRDRDAIHLIGFVDDHVVAYARLFEPTDRGVAGLGRVAVAKGHRGANVGRALIRMSLDYIDANWPPAPRAVAISAQTHLQRLYTEFGFVRHGAPYLEDGIPHVAMVRGG